jgi:hypothetical protein
MIRVVAVALLMTVSLGVSVGMSQTRTDLGGPKGEGMQSQADQPKTMEQNHDAMGRKMGQVEGTIKMVSGSTVTLEDGTQLSIPPSVRVAQNLKPGAQISAEYVERGGQKIATSIQIKG